MDVKPWQYLYEAAFLFQNFRKVLNSKWIHTISRKNKPWLPINGKLPDAKAKETSDLNDINHIKEVISAFKDELAYLENKKTVQ